MVDSGHFADLREAGLEIPLISIEDDDAFTGVAARPPKEIVLMSADGGRQSVFGTEEVNRPGLSVILAKDRGLGTYFGGKVVVDARNSRSHFLPTELVGIDLRQRPELMIFDRGRGEVQRLRIANPGFWRQDRNRQRREQDGGTGQQECRPRVFSARRAGTVQPGFASDSAARKQKREGGKEIVDARA